MHIGDHRRHRGQGGVIGVNDDVNTLAEDVEVTVGDKGGDLDQFVGAEVEPRHLAVDPDQFIAWSTHSLTTVAVRAIRECDVSAEFREQSIADPTVGDDGDRPGH